MVVTCQGKLAIDPMRSIVFGNDLKTMAEDAAKDFDVRGEGHVFIRSCMKNGVGGWLSCISFQMFM